MSNEPAAAENEPWLSIAQAQDCELIHREINKLPTLYRDAIVVCHVQGHSRSEAAELLNKSEISIKAALARGRNLLRRRLVRRGIMTTALLTAIQYSSESTAATLSESLVQSTLQTCGPPGGSALSEPSNTVSTIANNGVIMTSSLYTNSMLLATGLVVMCLPILLFARTNSDPAGATLVAAGRQEPGNENFIEVEVNNQPAELETTIAPINSTSIIRRSIGN